MGQDEDDEKGEKGSSVGDTMEHAAEELFGGLLPGGSNKDNEEDNE